MVHFLGVRPFSCTMCDKTYGRRDYLQRHLKSHNANFTATLSNASATTTAADLVTSPGSGQKVKIGNQQVQVVTVQQSPRKEEPPDDKESPTKEIALAASSSSAVQIIQTAAAQQQQATATASMPSVPFVTLNGNMTGTAPNKPIGSKICRWVQNDGTVCGKAFSKLDSLRRHVNELHKSIRPYACNLCEKSYGRRDYLDRHIKVRICLSLDP